MAFKAQQLKKGFLDIIGLEAFVERKVHEVIKGLRANGTTPVKSALRAVAAKMTRSGSARPNSARATVGPSKVGAATKTGRTPGQAVLGKSPSSKPGSNKPSTGNALNVVLEALEANPKKAALVKAGKQKDQLLRSLIPLYVAQNLRVEVSSGVTSKFWATFGLKYAAPNAAKALREHVGYAKRTKQGNQITPNGVKYVEAALTSMKQQAA
jgi:hypothetical protein